MHQLIPSHELETLIAHDGKPAVSIYLPTTRISTRVQAESLQFKNLLRNAEEELSALELRGPAIQALLEPARRLVADVEFWRHQQDGLAVFFSEDGLWVYQLPITFETALFVGQQFHLKPLMPLLSGDLEFYILAVSQNGVRFLQATRYSVEELAPERLPSGIQEVLDEYEFQQQLQFHTSTASPDTGRRSAIFHGVGAGATDDEKDKIREFLARIDRGLDEILHNERAPLIFAGVDYLFPLYRDVNRYPHLVEWSITGNPDHVQAIELHRQAWQRLEPSVDAEWAAEIERFYNGAGQGLAAMDVAEIVPWADQGRVDTLFVNQHAAVWGNYLRDSFRVEVHEERTPHNRDLTDLAAIYTLLRGGRVRLLTPAAMEMEFGTQNRHGSDVAILGGGEQPTLAAIYRYAL
jgi:hypothetical protein